MIIGTLSAFHTSLCDQLLLCNGTAAADYHHTYRVDVKDTDMQARGTHHTRKTNNKHSSSYAYVCGCRTYHMPLLFVVDCLLWSAPRYAAFPLPLLRHTPYIVYAYPVTRQQQLMVATRACVVVGIATGLSPEKLFGGSDSLRHLHR